MALAMVLFPVPLAPYLMFSLPSWREISPSVILLQFLRVGSFPFSITLDELRLSGQQFLHHALFEGAGFY